MMRVLISGGGIAGLTLAYWLCEYGMTPVVIEQSAGTSHDGYGLDFYGTGYDVAERMGLLEKLREQQLPFDDVAYIDSSACPTSMSGQGASMAMGGAYLLAETLHTAPDYASVFHHYEQLVRPHVEQRQANARKLAKTFLPTSPLGLVIQQIGMKLLLRDAFSGLLRQQFGAESLLASRHAHLFEPTKLPLPHR